MIAWDHVAHAIRHIDFSREAFRAEVPVIFDAMHGGYNVQDLRRMPFDEYDDVLTQSIEIQRSRSEAMNNGTSRG